MESKEKDQTGIGQAARRESVKSAKLEPPVNRATPPWHASHENGKPRGCIARWQGRNGGRSRRTHLVSRLSQTAHLGDVATADQVASCLRGPCCAFRCRVTNGRKTGRKCSQAAPSTLPPACTRAAKSKGPAKKLRRTTRMCGKHAYE